MDIEGKIDLISKPPIEEVVTVQDLRDLLETDAHPSHYIGLEISGTSSWKSHVNRFQNK